MIFLIPPFIFWFFSHLNLLEKIASKTIFIQNSCSVYFTSRLIHGELASAFICGTSLRDPQIHELFIQTGLIHLMVVSGSHLQMLSMLLHWLTPKKWKSIWFDLLLALLLLLYTFLSGFQPPVVRALIVRTLKVPSHFFRWNWDSGKLNLAAGLLILALSPGWIFNFSFFLSWLASLGLMVAPLSTSRSREPIARLWNQALQFWLTCFCIQALLTVALGRFSFLSLIMNSLLAPVLSCLLFPLSLSIVAIPSLDAFVDFVWRELLQLLLFCSQLASPAEPVHFPNSENWIFLWLFLAFLHGFFEFLHQFRYRGTSV